MLLSKLLTRTHFDSYADFKKNYELHVPEHFNFARDVVDAWAEADPEKRALVWLNDRGERRTFTFREISDLSKQAANFLSSLGLKKGDRILTLLKRNWQYWVTAVACHRMGVVIIPASVQLATKDIVYRVNAAGIRRHHRHRRRVEPGPGRGRKAAVSGPGVPAAGARRQGRLDRLRPGNRAGKAGVHDAPHRQLRRDGLLLHLRHDRHAQARRPRPDLSPGPHRDGQVLAARGGRRACT